MRRHSTSVRVDRIYRQSKGVALAIVTLSHDFAMTSLRFKSKRVLFQKEGTKKIVTRCCDTHCRLCKSWSESQSNWSRIVFVANALIAFFVLEWRVTIFLVADAISELDLLYPVSQKKQNTLFLPITLLNIDWFSKFFHQQTQQWLPKGMNTKDPTTP